MDECCSVSVCDGETCSMCLGGGLSAVCAVNASGPTQQKRRNPAIG